MMLWEPGYSQALGQNKSNRLRPRSRKLGRQMAMVFRVEMAIEVGVEDEYVWGMVAHW